MQNWMFGMPGWIFHEQSPWCQRKWWAYCWLYSSRVSPFSVCPELSMLFKHLQEVLPFLASCLSDHCEGLHYTFSKNCTKFDAVPLWDPSQNCIRPDTWLHI
jgi:hypothetical protein